MARLFVVYRVHGDYTVTKASGLVLKDERVYIEDCDVQVDYFHVSDLVAVLAIDEDFHDHPNAQERRRRYEQEDPETIRDLEPIGSILARMLHRHVAELLWKK